MPNRIIKESIRTSKSVNGMTDFQFRLWVYLITYVDDYGRGSADPELLKGFVFPRRKRVSESDIEKSLAELADMGCILLYDVDGESYFCFPNWSEHQRIQTKKSRFPEPENGIQRKSTVGHGDSPPESVSKSESESELESEVLPSPEAGSVCMELPLNNNNLFAITREQVDQWEKLYPAVDVVQQIRAMRGWLDANPTKRKTKNGVLRFVNGWLSKEQDKGGTKCKNTVQNGNSPSFDLGEIESLMRKNIGG